MADTRWLRPLLLAAVLTGCSDRAEDAVPQIAAIIPCAVAGASEFREVCIAEVIEANGRREIMVRHPDGSSRRFVVLGDGRRLAPADGREDAIVAVDGTGMRVSVSGDRYRFPATISADDIY